MANKVVRVLVGTYRPECLSWIRRKRLYNLPVVKGVDGASLPKFTHCVLFAEGHPTVAYKVKFSHVQDLDWLRDRGYPVAEKPHANRYAIYSLDKDPIEAGKILQDRQATIVVSSTRLPTCKITDEFFSKPLPRTEGKSTRYLFAQFKQYFSHVHAAYVFNPKQLDFMKELGVEVPKVVPFPGPSKKDAKFTFIDLFAGIGGFRIAMQNNGGRCVFSSEWNEDAQKTYHHNFGEVPFGDITSQATKDAIPRNFDILCAGFPCQAFSVAGYRRGFEDTRGTLFFDVAQILNDRRPRAFYLENVKNLKGHDNGRTFEKIYRVLTEDLGYIVFDKVMSPDKYADVPQNRERIFIVGFDPNQVPVEKIKKFRFPEPMRPHRTIADCIDYTIDDPEYFYHNKYECSAKIEAQVVKKDTVYQWRRHYVRENQSKLCPTLTANMGTGGHNVPLILTPDGVRKLTPRECLNFQGFPRAYTFGEISRGNCYKQAGNSVTVPLIQRVAKAMLEVLL